jgi:hypothetical protein
MIALSLSIIGHVDLLVSLSLLAREFVGSLLQGRLRFWNYGVSSMRTRSVLMSTHIKHLEHCCPQTSAGVLHRLDKGRGIRIMPHYALTLAHRHY